MRIIRGKKALVTGAASGIGRAIALALAGEGADVFLVDINADALADVAREAGNHGVKVVTAVCDLSDPAQIEELGANLRRRWNGLNILVNNAGIAYYGHTHLMTGEQWQRIMAVNLLAPIRLVHELLPLLLVAEEAHILNVSSMFGLATWRKTAAYQTSKFGLVGFSAALRAEYCSDTFGVTALCPGFVRSSLLKAGETDNADRQLAVPNWICASAEQTAAKAIRAIRRNRGIVLVTPAAHFYWRLSRFFPGLVDWLTREGWRRRGRPKIPADHETTSIGANNAAPSRDPEPQHREEMRV
ncbi:MAG TPA: SDR family NAD(P)-dependent oxidoreductase [Xanthobacteraceae bacterium]|jgi:3-oxoacyl-[acyl-carrier protein] reductase|nr:SDR family NAD(P)-dependent oxidoreductase [Xanthobacteraceae bacterium]